MKNILLGLLSFLLLGCCVAQPPTPGSYVTNNNIDKFVGTWKWVSGNDEIIFKLAKFRHTVTNYDEDIILGSHSYIQNGNLIESSLDKFNNLGNNHKDRSIYAWNDPTVSQNKIEGAIKDISKHKDLEIIMEYISGSSPAQVMVTLSYKHQTLTKDNQQPGMTLPATFTLIKQ